MRNKYFDRIDTYFDRIGLLATMVYGLSFCVVLFTVTDSRLRLARNKSEPDQGQKVLIINLHPEDFIEYRPQRPR